MITGGPFGGEKRDRNEMGGDRAGDGGEKSH